MGRDGGGAGRGQQGGGCSALSSANYRGQHHFNEDVKERTLGSSSIVFMWLLSTTQRSKDEDEDMEAEMVSSQSMHPSNHCYPPTPQRGRREA